MSPWCVTVEQVEAGYAAYRWIWRNIRTGEQRLSDNWFPTLAEAATDAAANNPWKQEEA